MKARDIMISDVPTVSVSTTVADAARTLRQNFGDESYLNAAPGLVVVREDGSFAGILSPLTIIRAICEQSAGGGAAGDDAPPFARSCDAIREKRVGEIMDWQAISVTEDADILDVAELFIKHRFQRIPVVSGQKVVGLIYRSRLMFAMAAPLFDSRQTG